jgi:hypothetical protein
MNHVMTQFNENGSLLGEFTRQIDKLRIKTDNIIRASAQMPRDAELLEARYDRKKKKPYKSLVNFL